MTQLGTSGAPASWSGRKLCRIYVEGTEVWAELVPGSVCWAFWINLNEDNMFKHLNMTHDSDII